MGALLVGSSDATRQRAQPVDVEEVIDSLGYEMDYPLSKGSFGTAYLVHLKGHQRIQFAVKVIPFRNMDEREAAEREAKLCLRLGTNKHIIQTFSYHIRPGFLVNQDCNAGSVESSYGSHGHLFGGLIEGWFYQLMNGLTCIHHNGIIHRDIKPDNLFFNIDFSGSNRPEIIIGDLGIAKSVVDAYACNPHGANTCRGDMSTFAFMSPELYS
jgi:serine/threonine protein kinase